MSKTELRALKRLRKQASLESFSSGNPETDRLIKEKTHLYLDTWVLPIIDALIETPRGPSTKRYLAQIGYGW